MIAFSSKKAYYEGLNDSSPEKSIKQNRIFKMIHSDIVEKFSYRLCKERG